MKKIRYLSLFLLLILAGAYLWMQSEFEPPRITKDPLNKSYQKSSQVKKPLYKKISAQKVAQVKIEEGEYFSEENKTLVQALKIGAPLIIKRNESSTQSFSVEEVHNFAPNFQTTLGVDKKNKHVMSKRVYYGVSTQKRTGQKSSMTMAIVNNAVRVAVFEPSGDYYQIAYNQKNGKYYQYKFKYRPLKYAIDPNSEDASPALMIEPDDPKWNLFEDGEEVEVFAAETNYLGGSNLDREDEQERGPANPPEYDKSLVDYQIIWWLDKAATNSSASDTERLDDLTAKELTKFAKQTRLYESQIGVRYILQEMVLNVTESPVVDPKYLNTAPSPEPDCVAGEPCFPLVSARQHLAHYRPAHIYKYQVVPFQMKTKTGDEYSWGGHASCCPGSSGTAVYNAISSDSYYMTISAHEGGHNLGAPHTLTGGIMGGDPHGDGLSFFAYAREGEFQGLKMASTMMYEKSLSSYRAQTRHTKYSHMRNPTQIPWAVTDNYDMIISNPNDVQNRTMTLPIISNDLPYSPDGVWNASMDVLEVGHLIPSHAGSIKLKSNNEVEFVANQNFYGTARFRYTLRGHLPDDKKETAAVDCLNFSEPYYYHGYTPIKIDSCSNVTDGDDLFSIPQFPNVSNISRTDDKKGCLEFGIYNDPIETKNGFDTTLYSDAKCNYVGQSSKWQFVSKEMNSKQYYQIRNQQSGYCISNTYNKSVSCDFDTDTLFEVQKTLNVPVTDQCISGSGFAIVSEKLSLVDCSVDDELRSFSIANFPNQSEIRRAGSTNFSLVSTDKNPNNILYGDGIQSYWKADEADYTVLSWNFIDQGNGIYKIQESSSSYCLSASFVLDDCTATDVLFEITQISGTNYQIKAILTGNYKERYRIKPYRQARDGWLHAADVFINVNKAEGVLEGSIAETTNTQIVIPYNLPKYYGANGAEPEFIFNPLLDYSLAPSSQNSDGDTISIYQNPWAVNPSLNPDPASIYTIANNGVSIVSLNALTPENSDIRIFNYNKALTTSSSGLVANGYLGLTAKKNENGQYYAGTSDLIVTVKDQTDSERDLSVKVVLPIGRINMLSTEFERTDTVILNVTPYLPNTGPTNDPLLIEWRKISGPDDLVFSGSDQLAQTTVFNTIGEYTLRMTASAKGYSTYQEILINIIPKDGETINPPVVYDPANPPDVDKVYVNRDGDRYRITTDNKMYLSTDGGPESLQSSAYKQISLISDEQYAYVANNGDLVLRYPTINGGAEINTGVKGKMVSLGIDGTIIAILEDAECTARSKESGCMARYESNTWNTWAPIRFTSRNVSHEIISILEDPYATVISVFTNDIIAFIDKDNNLFLQSEDATRGKEFWQYGGQWRSIQVSSHGRMVGINTLGRAMIIKEGIFTPIAQNIGHVYLEFNGTLTTVDYANTIKNDYEKYLFEIGIPNDWYTKNKVADHISLGEDGRGSARVFYGSNLTRFFNANLSAYDTGNNSNLNPWEVDIVNTDDVCATRTPSTDKFVRTNAADKDTSTNLGPYVKDISCGTNIALGLAPADLANKNLLLENRVLKYLNEAWIPVPGRMNDITTASQELVYGIDQQNFVYRLEGSFWNRIHGTLKKISVGADGSLVGIGPDDLIYIYEKGSWIQTKTKALDVDVSVNNQFYYIDMDGFLKANFTQFISVPFFHDPFEKFYNLPPKVVKYIDHNEYESVFNYNTDLNSTCAPTSGIYRLTNVPVGYVTLGQVVTLDANAPTFTTRVYEDDPDIFKDPVDYTEIITTTSSQNSALEVPTYWRPVAPEGYSCLSDVVVFNSTAKPSLNEIKCIHNTYVNAGLFEETFRAQKTGQSFTCFYLENHRIYRSISNGSNALGTNYLYAMIGTNVPGIGSLVLNEKYIGSTVMVAAKTSDLNQEVADYQAAGYSEGQEKVYTPPAEVLPGPLLTSVTPNEGFETGSTLITIEGENFQSGALVTLGDQACTEITFVSTTQITCKTPVQAPGSVNVIVKNPDEQLDSITNGYTYLESIDPPLLISVSPTSGSKDGQTLITLTGQHFTEVFEVRLGNQTCGSSTFINETSVQCLTPSGIGTVDISFTNSIDDTSTLNSAFTYLDAPAPVVSSLSPAIANPNGGTMITITGQNFSASAMVKVGVKDCLNILFDHTGQLRCTVPSGSLGVADVSIINPDNKVGTIEDGLTYVLAPTLSSISPNDGTGLGGFPVVITGQNFQPGVIVNIGESSCTGLILTGSTTINCTAPSKSSGGTVDVVVINPDQQSATLSNAFTYTVYNPPQPPVLTGMTPTTGSEQGGTNLTILGSNFKFFDNYDPYESLNGLVFYHKFENNLTDTQGSHPIQNSSGFQYSPISLAGSYSALLDGGVDSRLEINSHPSDFEKDHIGISLWIKENGEWGNDGTSAGSGIGDAAIFSNKNGNLVLSVNPNDGRVSLQVSGIGNLTGRQNILNEGWNHIYLSLGKKAGNNLKLYVNGVLDASVAVSADWNIGTQGFIIGDGPNVFWEEFKGYIDELSYIDRELSENTIISLYDYGVDSRGVKVMIGNKRCLNLSFPTSDSLTCVTPPNNPGTNQVVVTNDAAYSTSFPGGFTYLIDSVSLLPPILSVVTPKSGDEIGGTQITLFGSGFRPGATIKIGEVDCKQVIFVSSSEMNCVTAVSTPGLYNVTLKNPDHQSSTLNGAFTYTTHLFPAPTLSGISPIQGSENGNTLITLTGTNLRNGLSVKVGNSPCSIQNQTSTSVTCLTTQSPFGVVNITLTNPDGQTASLGSAFTYLQDNPPAIPYISSISKSSGSIAGGDWITINGSGFFNGSQVYVGKKKCQITSVISANQIICLTSAHPVGTYDIVIRNDAVKVSNLNGYTLLDGLIFYFQFEDNYIDTNNLIPLTSQGEVNFSDVKLAGNKSAYFSGLNNNSRLTTGSSPSAFDSEEITISFWMKSDGSWLGDGSSDGSAAGAAMLFSNSDSSLIVSIIPSSGTIYTRVNSGGQLVGRLFSSRNILDNNWHHILLTLGKKAGSNFKVYVDNTLEDTLNISRDWSLANQNFIVGDTSDTFFEEYKGFMDELAFFNRRLGTQEISSLYNFGILFQDKTVTAPRFTYIDPSYTPPPVIQNPPPEPPPPPPEPPKEVRFEPKIQKAEKASSASPIQGCGSAAAAAPVGTSYLIHLLNYLIGIGITLVFRRRKK